MRARRPEPGAAGGLSSPGRKPTIRTPPAPSRRAPPMAAWSRTAAVRSSFRTDADGAEAAMRWLVGWSSAAAGPARGAAVAPLYGDPDTGPLVDETVRPVAGQLLWGDPDPLWAVGDWRPDEIRVVHGDPGNRWLSSAAAAPSDDQLRAGLSAARGGALKHLTAWPGSYTAVVRAGRRITVAADLAGAPACLPHPVEGRHRLRHGRAPARRPHRGTAGHHLSRRPARLPRHARGTRRRNTVRRRTARAAGARPDPARRASAGRSPATSRTPPSC